MHLRALILTLGLASTALAACERQASVTQVPADATQSVISLQGIDCQTCGQEQADAMAALEGVYAAAFDRKLAELSVAYDSSRLAEDTLLQMARDAGYTAIAGAGQGRYLEEVEFEAGLDMTKISLAGEAVELEAHLVPGKVTVFDFYAAWCKPCREVDHHMKGKLAAENDVALRKLDIVDWDSELAAKYLGDVPNLPYVIIYSKRGKRVDRISGLSLEALDAAIEKARTR